ncbi:MAG: hypothetical protein ACR2JV_06185 [Gaiellales bacterium]
MPRDTINQLRIERIVGMMRRFEWVRGQTPELLAAEWGLAAATVRGLSAEASKIVSAEVMDRDAVRADVGVALQTALQGAVRDGDWKAVATLGKVFGDVSGASAPAKLEATVIDGAATPSAARAAMIEAFGRVTPPVQDDTDAGAGQHDDDGASPDA